VKRLALAALVVVALAFVAGLFVGMTMNRPTRITTPGAERVITAKPRPAVTVTAPPSIHYRDRTPGSCHDALIDADSVLTQAEEYRTASEAMQQAVIENDTKALAKATGNLNDIAGRMNYDRRTYGDDAAKCRGLERVK